MTKFSGSFSFVRNRSVLCECESTSVRSRSVSLMCMCEEGKQLDLFLCTMHTLTYTLGYI